MLQVMTKTLIKQKNRLKHTRRRTLSSSILKSLKEDKGLLWHVRLGHVSKQYLEKASKSIPELRYVKFNSSIQDCGICL